MAVHGPEAELGQAGQQRRDPPGAQRPRRRPAGDAKREIRTRRSASRAARAAAAGTPMATASTSGRLSDRSPGKNGWPTFKTPATGARSRRKIPNPTATPRTAAAVDSVAASSETPVRVALDQAHRREPLLGGGRQPGRGGDEDQHRGENGQQDDGQDQVGGARRGRLRRAGCSSGRRAARRVARAGTGAGPEPAQDRGDRRHPYVDRGVRQLRGGAPDDDDQRGRRGQPASPIRPASPPG